MIKVSITRDQDAYKDIRITGHAGSAEYGRDLVCAGVTVLAVGCYNTLEKLGENETCEADVREGSARFQVRQTTRENQVVLETLVTSLETLAESQGKYIQIRKEEA